MDRTLKRIGCFVCGVIDPHETDDGCRQHDPLFGRDSASAISLIAGEVIRRRRRTEGAGRDACLVLILGLDDVVWVGAGEERGRSLCCNHNIQDLRPYCLDYRLQRIDAGVGVAVWFPDHAACKGHLAPVGDGYRPCGSDLGERST